MKCTSSPKNTVLFSLAAVLSIAILSLGSGTAAAWTKLNDSNGTFSLGDQPSGTFSSEGVKTGSGFSETFSNPSTAAGTTTTNVSESGGTISATVSYTEPLKKQEDVKYIEGLITGDEGLQQAIKESMGLKELTEEKIKSIAEASAEVAKSVLSSRSISVTTGKTSLSLSVTYSGSGSVRNFIVYDNVPKTFAQSADNITVVAGGAVVNVIEKDPKYSFTYPTLSTGDVKTVSYSVNKQLDKSIINAFSTPIVLAEAVAKEEKQVPPPSEKKVPPEEKSPTVPAYSWKTTLAALAIILIIAAILKVFGKGKKQKRNEE